MEPPSKRPRTGPSPLGQQQQDDGDDELNYEPEEVSQMRDPGYVLETSRAFAAFKLKSTFEHIFEKYERDFTGIGDEIDLRTGKIITNNGHLENMRNEGDTGVPGEEDEEDEGILLEDAFGSEDDDGEEEEGEPDAGLADGGQNPGQSDEEEDEERILHGKRTPSTSTSLVPKATAESQRRPSPSQSQVGAPRPGSEQRLLSFASSGSPGMGNSNLSTNIWDSEPEPVDPAWRAPEIHQPRLGDNLMSKLYGTRYRFPVNWGFQSVWSSRPDSEEEKTAIEPVRVDVALLARAKHEYSRMPRPKSMRLLQAFTAEDDNEDDNEDDILGVSIAEQRPRVDKKKTKTPSTGTKEPTGTSLGATAPTEQHTEISLFTEDTNGQTAPAKSSSTKEITGAEKKTRDSTKGKRRPGRRKKTVETNGCQAEAGERQLKDAATEPGSTSDLPSIVTERELRERPKQQLVIELFSRIPQPEEVTEIEDPDDADTYDTAKQQDLSKPEDADTRMNGGLSMSATQQTLRGAVVPDATDLSMADAPATIEEYANKTSEAPKEKFTRHEIDPSYAFSDDEDGIPAARARVRRNNKAAAIAPERTESPQPTPEATTPEVEIPPLSNDGQQDDKDLALGSAAETNEEPANQRNSMEIDTAVDDQADEPTETVERPLNAPSRDSVQESVEDPSTMERRSTEEAADDQQLVQQDADTHESNGQSAKEEASIPVPPSLTLNQISQHSDAQAEDEDGGFTVPLGLDNVEEATAVDLEFESVLASVLESVLEAEPEVEPEAMDVEPPTLPLPAEKPADEASGSHSLRPRRRGRPKGWRRAQREVLSPKRRLDIQSSSPSRRHGAVGILKPRRSVRFDEPTSAAPETTEPADLTAGQRTTTPEPSSSAQVQPEATETADSPPPPPPPTSAAKDSPARPTTPSSRSLAAKASSSRRSFVSLLSDDDGDELTLDLFKAWTNGSGELSGGRKKTSYAPVLLAGPHTKISTPLKQQRTQDVGGGSGTGTTGKGKKRKAAWAFAYTPTKVHVGSPSGSLVRTPGGHMRRCGEEGFRCDRDFCFTCL